MKSTKAKHSYFLSTLSISLVLFLLGVVFYIGYIVENTANQVVSQIRVSALIKEDVEKNDIDGLIALFATQENVDSVIYVSKEDAIEVYKKAVGQDFTLFIEDNPLPASIDIIFETNEVTKEKLDNIASQLEKNKFVEEVIKPQGVVQEVLGHVYKIRFILYSFLIVLLLISAVLINNAIKLTTRSKRFLIKSMKLIGATDSFIRRPFISSAIYQGVNATLIAWLLFVISFLGVNRGFSGIEFSKQDFLPIVVIFLGVLIIGVIISVICTAVAVNNQIKQRDSDLHNY